jgi:hypothetical protein
LEKPVAQFELIPCAVCRTQCYRPRDRRAYLDAQKAAEKKGKEFVERPAILTRTLIGPEDERFMAPSCSEPCALILQAASKDPNSYWNQPTTYLEVQSHDR